MLRRPLGSFSHRFLAQAFEAIVVATAAAGSIAACGGSTASTSDGQTTPDGGVQGDAAATPLSYDGFTLIQPPASCAAPPSLLSAIHPADVNASIQRRSVTVDSTFAADSADGGAVDANGCRVGVVSDTLLDAYGDACSQATDAATCKQQVACVTPAGDNWLAYTCPADCVQTNQGTFYLEINGDALSFPTDLNAMLGTIDTWSEAVLIANSRGYQTPTDCAAPFPGAYRDVGGAFELLVVQPQGCGTGLTQLRIRVDASGNVTVLDSAKVVADSQTACAAGRRPQGFTTSDAGGAARGIGPYLTELAALEAASIAEFATLRDELRAHGAPPELAAGAERARRDEVRHARLTSRLVRERGGRPERVSVERRAPRSLEELAIHNAVEGCVRETFGALLATWQARHAEDAALARAFACIAEDETRHAAFSWQLAAWLDEQLDPSAAARVAAARAEAYAQLCRQQRAPHEEVAALAGAPDVANAARLLAEMGDLFTLSAA